MISYMKTEDSLVVLTQEQHDQLLMADWKPEDHEFNRVLTLAFEERNHRQSLAEAVKTQRNALNMSQRALAKLVGVSTRDICHIEQAKSNPTLSTQVKLLSSLGLTIEILSK
ncbi:MAG: helix-turn-helix transcriptional regulator [Rhodoluna sp.]|nr:helix-turn-helix transcriptional regulator [Rhodoluna sp.]